MGHYSDSDLESESSDPPAGRPALIASIAFEHFLHGSLANVEVSLGSMNLALPSPTCHLQQESHLVRASFGIVSQHQVKAARVFVEYEFPLLG